MVISIIRHCDKTPQTPPVTLVIESGTERADEAAALGSRLACPILDNAPDSGLFLSLKPDGLYLYQADSPVMGMRVDFVAGPQGYRIAQSPQQHETIARACGLNSSQPLDIVDATAGLGRDAFVLATLGARVRMIERSEVVYELLADGLKRATSAGLAATVERLHIIHNDAIDWLGKLTTEERPDVVYLDPMYSQPKRAAAGKELTLLAKLLGDQADADDLLPAALTAARKQVVVKRHRRAPSLAGMPPSHSLTGRSTRFDVYRVS